MMKVAYLAALFIFVFSAGPVIAERPEHIPAAKIIEVTLRDLKEDLNKSLQKQERLQFENSTLRKDIHQLERQLRVLAAEQSRLSGQPVSDFIRDEPAPSTDPVIIEERERRTAELTARLQGMKQGLEEDIRVLQTRLDGQAFEQERAALIESEKAGRAQIAKTEEKLRSLEKENESYLKEIKALEKEQWVLQQEISVLESAFP